MINLKMIKRYRLPGVGIYATLFPHHYWWKCTRINDVGTARAWIRLGIKNPNWGRCLIKNKPGVVIVKY